MTSQILVQKPKEEVYPTTERAIEMLDFRIDGISISRSEAETRAIPSRTFDFDVQISEKGRVGQGLRVEYAFCFGRGSSGQVCRVRGETVVRLAASEGDNDLQGLGGDLANELAVEIFRRTYEPIFLLHESMRIQAPSPWIMQEASLA